MGSRDRHAQVFEFSYVGRHERRYMPLRDACLDDYLPVLRDNGFGRGVVVQPSILGAGNSCMLEAVHKIPLADTPPRPATPPLSPQRAIGCATPASSADHPLLCRPTHATITVGLRLHLDECQGVRANVPHVFRTWGGRLYRPKKASPRTFGRSCP